MHVSWDNPVKDPSINPEARRNSARDRSLGLMHWIKPVVFHLRRRELFPKNSGESLRLLIYLLAAAVVPVILWQIFLLFKPMLYSSIHTVAKLSLWVGLGSLAYVGLMAWYGLWQSWLRQR